MITKIEENEDKILVTFLDSLDTSNASLARQEMDWLLSAQNKEITLDCEALNYISSSGLRLFMTLLKHSRANGSRLLVKNVTDFAMSVFKQTGFAKLFHFV